MTGPCLKFKRLDTNHAPRIPGSYNDEDNAHAPRPLEGTNEFAHPSVRIRYIYSGFGLDDKHVWDCGALVGKGGYQLRYDSSSIKPRPGLRQHESKSEYQCVVGVVIAYYGTHGHLGTEVHTYQRQTVEGASRKQAGRRRGD